jgi:hypothetical protein
MAVMQNVECNLPRPDIGELHDQLTAEFSKRLLGGAPVLPMTVEDVVAFVMAGTVNLMYAAVSQAMREQDPATMCCDNLVIYAARHGLDMLGATRSKGYAAITGAPNGIIPPTLRFVSPGSSREYKIDPGVTFNPPRLDANGYAVVRIVAIVGGPQFDMKYGEPLTVSTTTPGIDIAATVIGNGLKGGSDDETCDELRARVIAAEASGVVATNEAWYLQKIMTYPGVTRVCTEECGACCDPQHQTFYPFFEKTYGDFDEAPYGVPPCEVLEEMGLWMFGRDVGKGQGLAPVAIVGSFEQALPTTINVVLYCFKGCAEATRERVEDAMRAYLRQTYCVGSTICKDKLKAVAYDVTSHDTCFSDVGLAFSDDGIRHQDDAFFYLACEHFPVLGSVTIEDRASPWPYPHMQKIENHALQPRTYVNRNDRDRRHHA